MQTSYIETPLNYNEIKSYILTGRSNISTVFFSSEQIIFYDTCSFRKHSNYALPERQALFQYFKNRRASLFLTKCVLMELICSHQTLLQNYVDFIKECSNQGIKVLIFNEEDTFFLLSKCFSDTETINKILSWAVRIINIPSSTINITLNSNSSLQEKLIKGLNLTTNDLYKKFFQSVRRNKTHKDNLGEELIGLCMYVLANLPGLKKGKLCFLTEDKGAVRYFDKLFIKSTPPSPLAEIFLLSTPKLVQILFRENRALAKKTMVTMISSGNPTGIKVYGTFSYDLRIGEKAFPSVSSLVDEMIKPNGININF